MLIADQGGRTCGTLYIRHHCIVSIPNVMVTGRTEFPYYGLRPRRYQFGPALRTGNSELIHIHGRRLSLNATCLLFKRLYATPVP
jgi:hypothetical protein